MNNIANIYHNKGSLKDTQEHKYKIDYTREFYMFDINPIGAVRMTKSDTWKTNPNHLDPKKRQRKAVTQYFLFKNNLLIQSLKLKYIIDNAVELVFFVEMPSSWSNKKKEINNGMPCKVRPDCDNYIKSFMDSLTEEDGNIWNISAKKIYAYKGAILSYK